MNRNFAVQSKSFALYEAFKKEVEKIGFIYKEAWSSFDEKNATFFDCLFFCDGWSGSNDKMRFAFSNCSSDHIKFNLESDWNEAIYYATAFAKHFTAPKRKKIKISIRKIAERHGVGIEDVIIKL